MNNSLTDKKCLFYLLGAAILLRLLLMPFFAHVDLFSEYRRILFALQNDIWVAEFHRPLTFYLELITVFVYQLFGNFNEISFTLSDPHQSTSSLTDYFLFLQDPDLFRYLFIFKTPYLLFDLATAWVILNIFNGSKTKYLALSLWLFNPLTLFATYIFGRFEVFAIFFLAFSVWKLIQGKPVWATISFALALHCREIYLLLAPFFLLSLIDQKTTLREQITHLLTYSAVFLAVYLLPDWLLYQVGGADPFINPQTHFTAINQLFSLGYHWFLPIVIGLSLVAAYNWEATSLPVPERFIVTCVLALSVYFAFNVHSIHYASWLMLFPILALRYQRQVLTPLLTLFAAWIILWLLKTDSGVFTLFLAAPISQEFVKMGHFPAYFNSNLASPEFTLHKAIQIARSLFAATMLYLAYKVVKRPHLN